MAMRVPWPSPVIAKLPCRPTEARSGMPPRIACTTYPRRQAPAVWLLEGPTMRGPRMSNRVVIVEPAVTHAASSAGRSPASAGGAVRTSHSNAPASPLPMARDTAFRRRSPPLIAVWSSEPHRYRTAR